MTIDAKLTLDLERFLLGSGYYLHTTVNTDPLKTTPSDLINSLLVRLDTSSLPEVLARVCTQPDLLAYPEVSPPYTLHLVRLSSLDIRINLMNIHVGDTITINPIPDIWERILGSPAPFVATVALVGNPALTDDWVLASFQFPCYADNLSFVIEHLGSPVSSGSDGVAGRYNPNAEMYCRVANNYTAFSDLAEAINKLESVRAEAQGLVTEYEEYDAAFEGVSEETFT